MSKQECRPAYLRHKLAMEAAINKKDPPRVAEIFKRKPYAAANDLQKRKEKQDEQRRNQERSAASEA